MKRFEVECLDYDALLIVDGELAGLFGVPDVAEDSELGLLLQRCEWRTRVPQVRINSCANPQMAELVRWLAQPANRGPRPGKGQRKAHRRDRWK